MENLEKGRKKEWGGFYKGLESTNKISPEILFFVSLPITRVETRTNDGENDD